MDEIGYLLGQVDGMLASLDARVQAANEQEASDLQDKLFKLLQSCFWTDSTGSFADDLELFRNKLQTIT